MHHLPVVDDEGAFKGIVSTWDLVGQMVKDAECFPYNREWLGLFDPSFDIFDPSNAGAVSESLDHNVS